MSSKERVSQPTHNRRSQQQSISSNSNSYAHKKHQHSVLQQQHQQQQQVSQPSLQESQRNQKAKQQVQQFGNDVTQLTNNNNSLPEKLDTQKVIEMIKNADLYDLINISLRSSELKNEQVEQFISRALNKGQNTQQSSNQNINVQQLENLFTPPSKIGQRQAACISTSPNNHKLVLSNDENQNILTVGINQKKQQQSSQFAKQLNHNRSQQVATQQPLQPSILQNASNIQNDESNQYLQLIQQHHNASQQQQQNGQDKNQLMDLFLQQLAIRQAQLDHEDSCYESQTVDQLIIEEEEFTNQIPRELIPQPYSEQPTSPTDENLPESAFQNQNNSLQQVQQQSLHYKNDSFSDQDFAQTYIEDSGNLRDSSSRVYEQLNPNNQEIGYKGDQFSFQLKMRESMAKRSPGSSNYSTLKDSYQSSNKKNQRKSESKSSRKYENQLKMQHSIKYQHQLQQDCQQQPPQQLNRTLSNFRAYQQQNTLNRSTSSNNIQKTRNTQIDEQSRSFVNKHGEQSIVAGLSKTGSTRNLNQHTMLQKSFLQQSTSQILNESLNKTPKASRNLGININTTLNTGSMTQRLTTSQLTPSNLTDQERLSVMNQRKTIDMKKQQLLQSLQQLNIMHIRELERIKKPSQLAYLTSRLVCQFFYLFNSSNQHKQLHMEDLIEWEQIQSHINLQVMKYFNELQQQIKIKLLNPESMNNAQKEILEIKFTQLKEQYFTGDNLKIFKHINTNKNFQTIVNYILTVINYFHEIKNQEQFKEINQVNDNFDESKSFVYPGHNYDALITQRAQERKSTQQLESSITRGKSRNHNLNKNETTPTIMQSKKSLNNDSTQQQNLQKSASRSILLRRDRSQLLQNNNNQSFQTNNKSPINKTNRDISFNRTSQQPAEQSKTELSVTRKERNNNPSINNSARRNLVQSRSPLNAHRKININSTLTQTPTTGSRIAQKVQEFAQKNCELLQKHEFTQDLNEEAPLELNYKLMIESSGITAKIRESTAAIEQNMKYFQSPSTQSNIDMGLIEQIKQRRKDQLEREKSEDRISCATAFQSNKKLQEQL